MLLSECIFYIEKCSHINKKLKTKFIIGLGNPGTEYHETRHNAGFRVLDEYQKYLKNEQFAEPKTEKSKKLDCKFVQYSEPKVFLIYPQTFMNESGRCVRKLFNWYRPSVEDLLIVHDDVALNLGQLKVVKAGGAGGQHGVESIISKFGGQNQFLRLKFGVGPDPGGDKRAGYVLSKFPENEIPLLEKSLKLSVRVINMFIEGCPPVDIMNEINGQKFVI